MNELETAEHYAHIENQVRDLIDNCISNFFNQNALISSWSTDKVTDLRHAKIALENDISPLLDKLCFLDATYPGKRFIKLKSS